MVEERILRLEGNVLKVSLPQGKTQEELIALCAKEVEELVASKALAGKDVLVDGRITTGMSFYLGHALSHACRSISIYDPKEGRFIKCVWH